MERNISDASIPDRSIFKRLYPCPEGCNHFNQQEKWDKSLHELGLCMIGQKIIFKKKGRENWDVIL